MQVFLDSIKTVIPSFSEEGLSLPFRDADVDSIDLVTIRVNLERILGRRIPDGDWLNFNNIGEVLSFCESAGISNGDTEVQVEEKVSGKRSIVINMPQMALEALSENWLFKELGGLHWDKICDGLGKSSFNLKDDLQNRLYATFVRIRIKCSSTLQSFKENELMEIEGGIKRFGESMYFSDLRLQSNDEVISAELMTTFSIRNSSDNTKLAKSQPKGNHNSTQQFSEIPAFGNEYRLLKKGELSVLESDKYRFQIKNEPIFEFEYELNPYYDLNGVNLLYFAAYPIINDVCEAKFFNKELALDGRWEQIYYTAYKDVFYYANCNIDETIIYRLMGYDRLDDGSIQIQSIMLRKSDMSPMAKVFTVKSAKS
jgi:probable biosynthetic protein (TIGR04098 family)